MILEQLKQLAAVMGDSVPEGYKYSSLYDYVIKTGTTPPQQKVTLYYKRKLWDFVKSFKPKMKECFYNAQVLALYDKDLFTYWEGYVVKPPIPFPIHHGWTTYKGLLFDPTLRLNIDKPAGAKNIVIGEAPEGWEYFGRGYTLAQIRARWATGWAGSLLECPEQNFPLLREG